MATLLGHLATFHSFFSQGEILCTGGLAYLLRTHADAKAAVAALITESTGVEVPTNLEWTSEARQADTGRVDVEGRAGGIPLVKIEAKLGAQIGEGQLTSYAVDLGSRSDGVPTALLVLVPEMRQGDARDVIRRAFSVEGVGPWRVPAYPTVSVSVLAWERLLAAIEAVDCAECRSEVKQLAGLYSGTCGYRIVPVRSADELRDWRANESSFVALVDDATRQLSKGLHDVYPRATEWNVEPPEGLAPKGYHRRYVCGEGGQGPCFSIGVRDAFEGTGDPTPIWLRFASGTSHFGAIRRQIECSRFAETAILSGGHLWLPLEVPLNSDGPQMVASLVAQARAIVDVAYAALPQDATTEA